MGYLLYQCGIKIKFTHKIKIFKMKKLLSVLAIAAVMTACKGGEATPPAVDSAKIADSIAKAKADTTKKDSTVKTVVDSTKKDSTVKK